MGIYWWHDASIRRCRRLLKKDLEQDLLMHKTGSNIILVKRGWTQECGQWHATTVKL